VKTVSIFPILAAVAATSCIGLALVAPIDDAQAGKAAAGKLYCVVPSCPPRPSEARPIRPCLRCVRGHRNRSTQLPRPSTGLRLHQRMMAAAEGRPSC